MNPSEMTHKQRLSAGWKVKESPLTTEEMTHQERLDAGWKVSKSAIPKKAMTPQEKWEANERKWDDFGRGARVSGKKLKLGLQDLADNVLGMDFLAVSDEQRKGLAQDRIDANRTDSNWSKGGEYGTDIASFLIPGTAAYKAAKVGGAALNFGRLGMAAAPITAETLTGGAVAGARLPEGEETRGKNALVEMAANLAGAGIGSGVASLVSKAKHGIKISKSGKELQALDPEGLYTPGQIGQNPLWETVEKVSDLAPGAASAVKQAKDRGHDAMNKLALRSAAPHPSGITSGGHAGTKQVWKQTKRGYNAAWNNVGGVDVNTLDDIILKAEDFAVDYGAEQAGALNRIKSHAQKVLDAGPDSTKRLKQLDRKMATSMQNALNKGDITLVDDIKDLRKRLRRDIPKKNSKKLREMDKLYPKWLAVQKASYDASTNKGIFGAGQLNTAAKSVPSSKTPGAIGEGPLQHLSDIALETTGKKDALPPLSFWKRLAPGVESPIPGPIMDAGGRMAFGKTKFQQDYLGNIDDLPNWLKQLLMAGPKADAQIVASEL